MVSEQEKPGAMTTQLSVWQWIYRFLVLVGSWVFFAWGDPTTLIWLTGVTLLGYGVGAELASRVDGEPEPKKTADTAYRTPAEQAANRRILGLSIAGIVAVLVFFKYGDVVTGRSFIIPLGLSYYSLMVIGYLIDVYRGRLEAEKNLLIFALYVGFFPQATAGPIGRGGALLAQYRSRIVLRVEDIKAGLLMIALGIYEKWVMADNLRVVVDRLADSDADGLVTVMAMLLFSLVIYFDFAGYSLIAIGLGRLLGIRLQDNFHGPYLAPSVKDFWRRWHISLSTWFRDYLYIPLGGSRVKPWRRDLNTLIVFVISGAWHGQAIGFWLWGLLHGCYLVIENRLRKLFKRGLWKPLGRVVVFILVSVAWVPFYAGTWERTIDLYGRMFGGSWERFSALFLNGFGMRWEIWLILGVSVILYLIISLLQEKYKYELYEKIAAHGWVIFILALVLYTVLLLAGKYGSNYDAATFIYGGF